MSPRTNRRRTALAVLLSGLALLLSACASEPSDAGGSPLTPGSVGSITAGGSASPAPAGTASATEAGAAGLLTRCEYQAAGQASIVVDPPPTQNIPASGTVSYTLQLSEGEVELTLDREQAPCTVNSFAALTAQGYYDDTRCHRLTLTGIFVLQCGDPTGTGRGGPGYRYADELSGTETYPAGTVAMANAGPDTNGSQFFIVWADTRLSPDYTVFGSVDAASLAVVRQIAAKGVAADGSTPVSEARILSVTAG